MSAVPAFRAWLVDEMRVRLGPVQVLYAADGADLQREAVWLGAVFFTSEPAGFRSDRQVRRETFEQRVVIYTGWEGRDAAEADARAFELFDALDDLLADPEPDLDGVESIDIVSGTSRPEGSDVGFVGFLEVTVRVVAEV